MSVHSQQNAWKSNATGHDDGGAGAGGDGGASGGAGNGDDAGAGSGAGNGAGTGNESAVDLKTLSADQLQQVLENPELWKQPRLQDLVKSSKDFKKMQADKTAADEKALEENNEHKTLAESRKTELEKANETIKDMQLNQALTGKLVSAGAIDIDAALKLIDRSNLKISDGGTISGVDDALKSLKTDKGYLFKEGDGSADDKSLGSASNSGDGAGAGKQTKFKRSQLKDPEFYQKNREAILEAQKQGLIEDDLSV